MNYKDTNLRELLALHRLSHGFPQPEDFEGGSKDSARGSNEEHTQEQLLVPNQVPQDLFLADPLKVPNGDERSSPFFTKQQSENPFHDIIKNDEIKMNKVNFDPSEKIWKSDSVKSKSSKKSKHSIKKEVKADPIIINQSQLQNKKSFKRSKTIENDPLITQAEKKKNQSAQKLKKKQIDRELWIKLQTQNRYQPDTVEKMSSLKDVLQKRAQFNYQVQKHMEKLERRCQIGHKEFSKYKQNWVNIQQSDNITPQSNFMDQHHDENKQEQKESRYSYKKWVAMYEDAISKVKNDQQFFVHGKIVSFSKNSLAIFDNKTKIRFFLVWIVTSKQFETFIISLILFNSALLGLKDYTDVNNETVINKFVEDIEPLFTYVFLMECTFKILAMGFILGRNSYLSDGWNWLDFIVVVTSLLENVPAMKNISGLRTFRLFRPLRSLTTMPSMKLLIGTLFSSVSQLGGIMGLAIFFFMIFAILGVSLWAGRINYRCYETEWPDELGNWQVVEDDPFLCSSSRHCKEGAFCTSRYDAYDAGYNLSISSLRIDSDINELNYGLTNFDNMGSAFLTIFQCITMEGWTKIMNIYEDAYASWFVVLYFILCVVICSFFLLNLTIAVMLMKYEELDKTQKNSKHNEDLIQLGVSINLPQELITFLINQGSIQIQSGASKMLRQEDSFFKQLFAKKKIQVDVSKSYYKNPIVAFCFKVLMNPYFDSTIIFVIILNTMCLAMDKYPQFEEEWIIKMLNNLNFLFTVIFTAEAVIKMVGLGFKEFNKEKFNQFDLVIVIISIAEMQVQNENDGPGVMSSFRAFRLFKIFRLFRVGDLRILLDSIQFTLTTIGDYVILLLLFIYVFALIGMSFFSGQMKFDEDDKVDHENGESPRTNFDNLGWAVITILQVLLGEGWNEIMYSCMRSVNLFWAVYYIALVVFGNIIMLNLFLAILLGNFDKARNYGQKKKVFEAFKEIMEKKSLNEALDIILGDMSIHVKTKILKWDQKEVEKIHIKGDTKIAMDLLEQKQRFMHDDSTLNENLITRKLAASHIDITTPKSQGVEPKQIPLFGKLAIKSSEEKKAKFKKSFKSGLEKQFEQKLALIEAENKLNKPQFSILKRMTQKQQRYARIVEKYHKPNPKILRLREMNRQNRIFPFQGLKEILSKQQDLEKIGKIDFTQSMIAYQQQRGEFHNEVDDEQSESMESAAKEIEDPLTFKGRKGIHIEQKKKLNKTQTQSVYGATERKNSMQKSLTKSNSYNMQESHSKSEKKKSNNNKKSPSKKAESSLSINLAKNVSRQEFLSSFNKETTPQYQDQDYFTNTIDNEEEIYVIPSFKQRFQAYVRNSSIFIFHRDWKIRKICQQLAETPEVLQELETYLEQGGNETYPQGSDSGNKAPVNPETVNRRISDKKFTKNKINEKMYKTFDQIILVLILLSSIMLVIDNPLLDPKSDFMRILGVIDLCFTVLFFFEAMIKIIAKGFFYNNLGPVMPYMNSYWNMLDAFVVAASLVDLVFLILKIDMQSLQALKALRALRALRPLRVISKNEGMRLIVNALLASIPSMTNVLLVCSLFILIFAIMGVNFFKGTFYSCVDPPNAEQPIDMNTIITYDDCMKAGGEWQNKEANFDSTLQAMLTLFIMMTTEGWVDVMNDGVDGVGILKQPKQNANIALVIFFVAFMIVGSQFIINLFVGVVIDNFNTIKEKEELGNMFVTEQQRSWIEIQKVGQGKKLRIKINEPQNCQKIFFNLVNHRYFEYTITFFILMNTIVMAMKHYRMSDQLVNFSEQINYVFALVFNLEMILKLIGLGKIYFLCAWNKFDMVIVFATDFGLVLALFDLGASFTSTATVIRGFRIMRMFKLIRSSVHMRLILDTVFNILPQVSNVMALIFLLFFIYAALGINLFSGVMLQEFLDSKNNFQSFDKAMIVLMKFSTGEDWNYYMFELANKKPYNGEECLPVQSYEDYKNNDFVAKQCGTPFSFVFFISFTILVSMLIMNLSVAAVIEGLDNAKKENMGIVEGDEIEILIDMWQDYDPMATGWISMKDLVFLLYELPPPLGKRSNQFQQEYAISENENKKNQGSRQQERYLVHTEKKIVMKKLDALRLLQGLKIKVYTDTQSQTQARVHFVDVFKALIKRIFMDKQIDYKLSPNLNKKIRNQWDKKHKEKEQKQDRTDMTAEKEQAALIITRWARKQLNQQRNTYKKAKKPGLEKNKGKVGGNQNNAAQTDAQARKVERQQIIKEQAQIIFNIINNVDDKDHLTKQENDRKYKLKNKFSWMHYGGEKILNHLNEDSVSSSDNEQISQPIKGQLPLVKEESEGEVEATPQLIQDQYEGELFGPQTSEVIKKYQAQASTGLKIQEQMHINIMNMEDGQYDIDSKQVYVIDDDGVPKRDIRIENNEKILDVKKGINVDNIENINYMPNSKYNLEQTKKLQRHMKNIEKKKEKKIEEENLRQQLVPYYARDSEAFKNGGSNNTVAMDERFIEQDSFHQMNKIIQEAEKNQGLPQNFILDQFEEKEEIRLKVAEKPVNDILNSRQDRILMPSKAKVSTSLALEPGQLPFKSALNSYSVTNKEYKQLFEEEKKRDKTPNNNSKEPKQRVVANNFFEEK